jgi:solute carrier family 6 (neurotransmitter transporter, glycine) member 5/9
MDTFTSLLAGFTIFAILGNLAHVKGVPISQVVSGGSGLAFIAYPETIASFDTVPQVKPFFLILSLISYYKSFSMYSTIFLNHKSRLSFLSAHFGTNLKF